MLMFPTNTDFPTPLTRIQRVELKSWRRSLIRRGFWWSSRTEINKTSHRLTQQIPLLTVFSFYNPSVHQLKEESRMWSRHTLGYHNLKWRRFWPAPWGGSLKMQDMEGSQSQKDEQSMTQSHRHRCSDGAWAWHWPWEAGCHVQSVRTGQQLWRCSEDYTVYKHTMLWTWTKNWWKWYILCRMYFYHIKNQGSDFMVIKKWHNFLDVRTINKSF